MKTNEYLLTLYRAFLCSILVCMSAASLAQEEDEEETTEQASDGIEEVIVTVERREQNLQDLGVTAYNFGGDDLKQQGVQDLTDLSELAPGLEIGNKGGNVEVWIRGVGSSNNTELGDPAAATHFDGIYLPRAAGIGSAFFDIARVEVNVGPQGTLRGRNATAGSVNIIPWRPGLNRTEMALEVETGDYDARVTRGVVNLPLGNDMAVRFAGYKTEHSSYYNDVGPLDLEGPEAADNQGYRLQLLGEWDRLQVLFAYDDIHEQGTGWTGTNYANPLGNGVRPEDIDDPRDVYARAFTPKLDTTHWGAKLQINYELNWGTVEYQVSRRDLVYNYDAATPLAPDWPGVANVLQPVDEIYDNWSRFQFITDSVSDIQELRLFGDTGAWSWTTGLFWFTENQYTFLGSVGDRGLFFQGVEFNQPDTDSSSTSAYGDVTYHWTEETRLTAGLRFTADEKSREGVNARYAFALGGRNFSCCGGVRLGTEGFEFAARDRTIFDPDTNGDGTVSDDEYLAFYYDGIKSFGARDNVLDIFAKGTYGGGAAQEDKVACFDTQNQDDFYCPPDGLFSFVAIINPNSSITPQYGEMENNFLDWRFRIENDCNGALCYAMISTGHKSGGFNDTFTGETGLPVAPTYDEEQVVVYEAGWKNDFNLGDTPTRFNVSGFYYDYGDQVFTSLLSVEQALDFNAGGVTLIDPTETGSGSLVVSFSYNAADSRIYGMQMEGGFQLPYNINFNWTALWLEAFIRESMPIQDFRFQADVSPEEAIFRSINDRRLPHTPKFQLNGSMSQLIGTPWGAIDYVVSIGWRDDQFRTIFNSIDYLNPNNPRLRLNDKVEGFVSVDAGVGYSHPSGRFRVEGFISNLTGEVHEAAQIIT
ncbi:MAG: TonB-dependent receptor plug domain-containing protein, partial [Gammaproteobacteria bacterium]|nr:TonB-dependent receptor plug domain-containing protein [Gammaproteobacteria bacterium]